MNTNKNRIYVLLMLTSIVVFSASCKKIHGYQQKSEFTNRNC